VGTGANIFPERFAFKNYLYVAIPLFKMKFEEYDANEQYHLKKLFPDKKQDPSSPTSLDDRISELERTANNLKAESDSLKLGMIPYSPDLNEQRALAFGPINEYKREKERLDFEAAKARRDLDELKRKKFLSLFDNPPSSE
jgi:hypothetical protein